MKTLIDIDPGLLKQVMKTSQAETKKEAIRVALEAYLKQKKRESLALLVGRYQLRLNHKILRQIREYA